MESPLIVNKNLKKSEPAGWRTGGFLVSVLSLLEEHCDARNFQCMRYGLVALTAGAVGGVGGLE